VKKKIISCILLLAIIFSLTGCALIAYNEATIATEAEVQVEEGASEEETAEALTSPYYDMIMSMTMMDGDTMRHRARVEIVTGQMESSLRYLEGLIREFDGYVTSFSIREVHSGDKDGQPHFVFRVPSGHYQAILKRLYNMDNLFTLNLSTTNLTEDMNTVVGSLSAFYQQLEQLEAIKDGDVEVSDLILLHMEIGQILQEVVLLESEMTHMAQSIEYSTIEIGLRNPQVQSFFNWLYAK